MVPKEGKVPEEKRSKDNSKSKIINTGQGEEGTRNT